MVALWKTLFGRTGKRLFTRSNIATFLRRPGGYLVTITGLTVLNSYLLLQGFQHAASGHGIWTAFGLLMTFVGTFGAFGSGIALLVAVRGFQEGKRLAGHDMMAALATIACITLLLLVMAAALVLHNFIA